MKIKALLVAVVAVFATLFTTGIASAQPTWWQPTAVTAANQGGGFEWYLNGELNTGSTTQMGTTAADLTDWQNGPMPNDKTAPAIYDIDGIENPASTVTTLHGMGDHAICYIEVGTAGNYYTAAQEGIPTTYYAQLKADGDLGNKLSGYPEYFINFNAASAVSIIEAMISQQCAAKGFDGVETDLDETYGTNEGKTGFTLTEPEEVNYLETLSNYMHGLGLAWVAKNLDDTGNQSFVTTLEPYADALITEECNFYDTCSLLTPFTSANKLVLNAEYTNDWGSNRQTDLGKFCAADISAGIDGTLFTNTLAGPRNPCE